MVTLRWAPLPSAAITSYNIYRSIVGFQATIPDDSLDGLTLILSLNGHANQTFTFDSGDPVARINATIQNGIAVLSDDARSFFVRASDEVNIIGGTALTLLGLSVRDITALSESTFITNIPVNADPLVVLEYDDPDGLLQDYYAISTVDTNSSESNLTDFIQPMTATGPLCTITGLIVDSQGNRIVDTTITATIETMPQTVSGAGIITTPVTVRTDSAGRFRLPLLQGALVRLEVPVLRYARVIKVPTTSTADFLTLPINRSYQFNDRDQAGG